MPKTCIICHEPAGSAEHVLPAALGGRRTNRGIYCEKHNKDYSHLVKIIKEQLEVFNAELGVIKDHDKEESDATMTEVATGEIVVMTASGIRPKETRIIAKEVQADGSILLTQSFNSQADADAWVAAERAAGNEVRNLGPAEVVEYFAGTLHKKITLGGNEEGMRSIAYIAQTFLAQAFPDLARAPELQALKDYTLHNLGSGFVWWEFDPPTDLPEPPYMFGHRVIVGHDSTDGTVYARISLFGSLNFALILGSSPTKTSRTVVTDIDPLALRAPADTQTQSHAATMSSVSRPADPTRALRDAVATGRGEREINALVGSIRKFGLYKAAGEMMVAITDSATHPASERRTALANIIAGQSARILMVMHGAIDDMRSTRPDAPSQAIAALLGEALKRDATAANGLTPQALQSLEVVRAALVEQVDQEVARGTLDQDRLAMLIGGGPGAAIMLKALISSISRK